MIEDAKATHQRSEAHGHAPEGTSDPAWLDEALRGARAQLEEDALTWVADLAVAHDALALPAGIGAAAELLEARQRLVRLEQTLLEAPARVVAQLRLRTAAFAATSSSQLRQIGEQLAAGTKLNTANVRLRQVIAERRRIERDAMRVERGLREVRERFESAFNNAPIGMALIAMSGEWLQVNDALCRITGRSASELVGTTLRAMTHADDADLDAESLSQLVAGLVPNYQVEKRLNHAWGHDVWVLITTSIVRDHEEAPLHFVTQLQDISERKELASRLEYVVDHDFLTGLHNRRYFEQELTRETERSERYGIPGAVLLIDLDNFKDVNDTFGHRAGDDVLKGVAGLLRQRLRHTDVVARVGGDEFAVLLTQTDPEQVQAVAEEVVRALSRETAMMADRSIRVTVSVGVALFDGRSDAEVLACADLAMYEAKETGRNRFEIYRAATGERERVSARLAEGERVRRLLEEDRLLLYAQPIVDLASGATSQYELLLRLPDAEGGEPLTPSAFLYHAERSGLIQGIDAWVVHRAIGLIAEHAHAGRRLKLSVNFSGRSMGDRRLAAGIEKALTESGIDPSQLTFELTETAAISNFEEAKAFACRLHGRGCTLALDDFGAGFGSFYYLKNFPFEYLKIDGDFIRDLPGNPMNQLVVAAIVSIARGMGKKTVAEFVADEATVGLLRSLGVDFAQGYHIGMPAPVADVLPPIC